MNKKTEGRWILAAMAAPLVQASSNCSWTVVAVVSGLCMGIVWGMEELKIGVSKTRIVTMLQWLWMLLVASEFLHWTMFCWPDYKSYHAVPSVILALAAWLVSKGKNAVQNVAGVLLPILVILFGAVLYSGVKEINIENLLPQWKMQTAFIIVVMLLPAMCVSEEEIPKTKMIFSAVGVSLISSGVLSMGEIEKINAPIYELSRSITLFGAGKRYESIIASCMTIGYFLLMCYLLEISAQLWANGKNQKRNIWISALFIGLVFISGMRINSRLLAAGTLVLWIVLPVVEKISKNMKKPLDK